MSDGLNRFIAILIFTALTIVLVSRIKVYSKLEAATFPLGYYFFIRAGDGCKFLGHSRDN